MVIFQKKTKALSYELLYRTVYKLTMRQFGERLYHDVEKVIAECLQKTLQDTIVPVLVQIQVDSLDAGTSFLNTMNCVWNDYMTAIMLIMQMLMYLVKGFYFYTSYI